MLLIKSHLSRYGLTTDAEDRTLPWGQKVHWPRLLRVAGIVHLTIIKGCIIVYVYRACTCTCMHLLSHVEAKMHGDVLASWWYTCIDWWHYQLAIISEGVLQDFLCCINYRPVIGPLFNSQLQVCFGIFENLFIYSIN